jgi:hypothetical protein
VPARRLRDIRMPLRDAKTVGDGIAILTYGPTG